MYGYKHPPARNTRNIPLRPCHHHPQSNVFPSCTPHHRIYDLVTIAVFQSLLFGISIYKKKFKRKLYLKPFVVFDIYYEYTHTELI